MLESKYQRISNSAAIWNVDPDSECHNMYISLVKVLLHDDDDGLPAVVDNLPKVPKEKLEKLIGVIERIFGQVGTIKEGAYAFVSISTVSSQVLRYSAS